eukprot:augustus_masked-scaffold_29-processed-gene-1.20-mRNA-1 protein AED:1.00 eAED:1.00 QI:0/-1/0/0/-1/1/1/0/254
MKLSVENAPLNKRANSKPYIIEAFHYRFHPLTLYLKELKEKGDLGEVEHVKAQMKIPFVAIGSGDIRYNCNGKIPELAGGSMMDTGCYALDQIRFWLGDEEELEVIDSKMQTKFDEVDHTANVDLKLGNKTARLETSFSAYVPKIISEVETEKKKIKIFLFMMPFIYSYVDIYDKETKKKERKKVYTLPDETVGQTTYYYQLKAFSNAVLGDEEAKSVCEFAGGMGKAEMNMRIIDQIYIKTGLKPRQGKPLKF